MMLSTALFWGLHLLSILILWILLAEYRRLSRERREFLSHMSGIKRKKHVHLAAGLYLLTTLFIFAASAYVFFR